MIHAGRMIHGSAALRYHELDPSTSDPSLSQSSKLPISKRSTSCLRSLERSILLSSRLHMPLQIQSFVRPRDDNRYRVTCDRLSFRSDQSKSKFQNKFRKTPWPRYSPQTRTASRRVTYNQQMDIHLVFISS
jgi:hypothetical protein